MLNYWKLARVRLLLYGILPMITGGVLAAVGWTWYQESAGFIDYLRTTEGRDLRIVPGDGGPRMEVQYFDEAGIPFTKQLPLDGRDEAALQRAGKVSLVYDARDPGSAEEGDIRTANRTRLGHAAFAVTGVLLFLIGIGVIGRESRRVMSIRGLLLHGQRIHTEVRDSAVSPHTATGRFTYAFRGPDGRWFEGKSPDLSFDELAAWPVGRRLIVAYDRRDPKQNEPDIYSVAGPDRNAHAGSA